MISYRDNDDGFDREVSDPLDAGGLALLPLIRSGFRAWEHGQAVFPYVAVGVGDLVHPAQVLPNLHLRIGFEAHAVARLELAQGAGGPCFATVG